mmetsp:Transcript_5972/g.22594  ORF Transcript_5972/g.22594 Transcript_5972/m.22594 type:complete len:247 (+) Transcript_5972:4419-5159(+)
MDSARGKNTLNAHCASIRAMANAAPIAASRVTLFSERIPVVPAAYAHIASTLSLSWNMGGSVSARSGAASSFESKALHAPSDRPSGAATSTWCARSTTRPARSAGISASPLEKPTRLVTPFSKSPSPQNAPSAAPARRFGKAGREVERSSCTSRPNQPPTFSADTTTSRKASNKVTPEMPASCAASIADRAATRVSRDGCSNRRTAVLTAACVTPGSRTSRTSTQPNSAPTPSAAHNASSHPSFAR